MKRTTMVRVGFRFAVIAALVVAIALLVVPFGAFSRVRAEDDGAARQEESGTPTTESNAVQSATDGAMAIDANEEAAISFTLRVFYYRPDGNYDGYNMWIWGAGAGGDYTQNDLSSPGYFQRTATLQEKKCAYLTIEIKDAKPSGGNILGLIVRKSEGSNWWAWQSSNMYVSADKVRAGERTDVYIVDGIEKVYYDRTEALTDKITSALFVDNAGTTSVSIATNAPIKATTVLEVRDGAGNVKGTLDCTQDITYVDETAATIAFAGDVDFGTDYSIVDTSGGFTTTAVLKHKLYDTQSFAENYTYDGELGAIYSAQSTEFKVWSPVASAMSVYVYENDTTDVHQTYPMTRGDKGVFSATVSGDLNGKYYTYFATVNGKSSEVVDPYATSGGKNGDRGMVLDLDATDPTGWATQGDPKLESYSHAVIYEAQLRDLTIHDSSNVSVNNRGKYLGLTEKGTEDKPTPLDYIKELGVTAVHFQPLFDFASVDESFAVATYNKDGEFNWGYDPKNYNMPEGSYSSNPSNGAVRVNEMKQMIMALHNENIPVIMDVVYNHMASASDSPFEALVPGYFFRQRANGSFYNGSGCGNETASERAMFRKFMIDSVKLWTTEYKVDGFRFDLMGLHDIETMNMLYDAVAEINDDVIIYGEGWTGNPSEYAIPEEKSALQKNAAKMPKIGVFNDIIRDGLKGSVFNSTDTGFVSGKPYDAAVYVGAAGATSVLSEERYQSIGSDKAYYAAQPTQSINYVSAHDNSALWDKLNASVDDKKSVLKAMNRLAATSVITSQGVSFFLAGEELMRSKPTTKDNSYDNRARAYLTDPEYYYSDNSYKSPDSVNAIRWTDAKDNADMVEFYKGLIGIKKTFGMFQIDTRAELESCLTINDTNVNDGVAAYAVKDPATSEYAVVILNSLDKARTVSVPNGKYKVFVKGDKATADKEHPLGSVKGASVDVPARSAIVMTAELDADAVTAWKYSVKKADADDGSAALAIGLGVGIPVALLIIAAVVVVIFFKKKSGKASGEKAAEQNAADGNEPDGEEK